MIMVGLLTLLGLLNRLLGGRSSRYRQPHPVVKKPAVSRNQTELYDPDNEPWVLMTGEDA